MNLMVDSNFMKHRQIALDTETTGFSVDKGHRIIEIGGVEIIDRRVTGQEYHCFINPGREIDEGAKKVHGISQEELLDKPIFEEIVDEFLGFLNGAELIMHNAQFDVSFIENELRLMGHEKPLITDHGSILDTLILAREKHPGQRNSLDALCKRYEIDNSKRQMHGALIDADLLSRVYLTMTGGQKILLLEEEFLSTDKETFLKSKEKISKLNLLIKKPSSDELKLHEEFLDKMSEQGICVWRNEK